MRRTQQLLTRRVKKYGEETRTLLRPSFKGKVWECICAWLMLKVVGFFLLTSGVLFFKGASRAGSPVLHAETQHRDNAHEGKTPMRPVCEGGLPAARLSPLFIYSCVGGACFHKARTIINSGSSCDDKRWINLGLKGGKSLCDLNDFCCCLKPEHPKAIMLNDLKMHCAAEAEEWKILFISFWVILRSCVFML